jgi:hypothetical protein
MLNADLRAVQSSVAVPPAELRSLAPVASAAGISLRDILRGLDLAPELLDGPRDPAIGLADYFRILERFSLALHDESCGLTARPLMLGATDLVLSSLSGCRDLPDVMRTVAHTYNILHGGPYNRVEVRSDRLTYVIDDTSFPYVSHADPARILFRMNCVLVFLHALLTLVAGDALAGSLQQVHTKGGADPLELHLLRAGLRGRRREPHRARLRFSALVARGLPSDDRVRGGQAARTSRVA